MHLSSTCSSAWSVSKNAVRNNCNKSSSLQIINSANRQNRSIARNYWIDDHDDWDAKYNVSYRKQIARQHIFPGETEHAVESQIFPAYTPGIDRIRSLRNTPSPRCLLCRLVFGPCRSNSVDWGLCTDSKIESRWAPSFQLRSADGPTETHLSRRWVSVPSLARGIA